MFLPVSSILIPLLRSFSLQNKAGNRKIIAMEKVPFFTFTNIKKTIYDSFLTSLIGKSGVVRFFGGQKKIHRNPHLRAPKGPESTLSSWRHQQIRRAGILCHQFVMLFFFGGVVWVECRDLLLVLFGHWPHTIKRREAIYFYIYYLICAVSFLFLDICVFYLYPWKSNPPFLF